MKFHRILITLVLTIALLTSCAVCYAHTIGDYEVGETEAGWCILGKYFGDASLLTIPSSFEIYDSQWPIGAIEEQAFIYNDDLKEVVIPEGVKSIGYRAFYGCENLERVVIPSTLENIEDEAFAHCTSLKYINFPKQLFYVGEDVFMGCDSLTLTPEQQDVLVNTEYAADLAQQAAFDVDVDHLEELTPYLGTSFREFIAHYDDMEDCGYTDGTGYANKDITVGTSWMDGSDYDYDSINYIEINRKCNYSLCGIYPTMRGDEALRILQQNGWTITDKYSWGYCFEDAYENYFDFSIEDDGCVGSITFMVSWDISEAIDSGIYRDFADAMAQLQGGSDVPDAEGSAAYTTGDVNLRSGPGLAYDTVGSIGSGVYIEYLGESSVDERGVAWYHVRYNGMTGWSSSKYVDLM